MIRVQNIRSLSDFQRNTKEHLLRLKESGKPEVLTVNGHAELVVLSADAYQKMVDDWDLVESSRIVRERLAAYKAGSKGVPASTVLAEVREILGIGERR